mgnify:CR=1 FL=1
MEERDQIHDKYQSLKNSNTSSEELREEIAALEKDALISMKQLREKENEVSDLNNRYNKTKEQVAFYETYLCIHLSISSIYFFVYLSHQSISSVYLNY